MTVAIPPTDPASRSLSRYAPPTPLEPRREDFDILSVLRLLQRRYILIASIVLAITAAAAPSILAQRPVYYAESRLMIRSSMASTLATNDPARNDVLDLPTEAERLLARNTAERVIADLGLARREEFNPDLAKVSFANKVRASLREWFTSEPPAPPKDDKMERIVIKFYQALTVRRDGASNVIQIGFLSQDPNLAASVPNKLLSVYLDERASKVRSSIELTTRWLQHRIVEQQARVNKARDAADKYRDVAGLLSSATQAEQNRGIEELADRRKQIAQVRNEISETISSLESSDRERALADAALPDSVRTIQSEARQQQGELARLLQTYGESADDIVELRAKIRNNRSALDLEIANYLQSQRQKLANLDRESSEVRSELAVQSDQIARSSVAQAQLTGLIRSADLEQVALDKLEQQSRSLVEEAALPVTEVEVLSPASVPLGPQGRGRLFYLLGAIFASLSIGITAALLREMADKAIRSHDELGSIPGLAAAGLIPLVRRPGTTPPSLWEPNHIGILAESLGITMVALKQSNGGRFPHSLLVTAALDREGKSFIARSLAIELVAIGQPVLLVDADLTHGSLAGRFNQNGNRGLREYLSGEAALEDVIFHDASSGVDFIARGNTPLDRRFNLNDISAITKLALAKGQVAIFDSAPVLASTDTINLAGQVERVLLVVRWAKSKIRTTEFAIQRLRSVNREKISVAINQVIPRKHKLYGFSDSDIFTSSLTKYQNNLP